MLVTIGLVVLILLVVGAVFFSLQSVFVEDFIIYGEGTPITCEDANPSSTAIFHSYSCQNDYWQGGGTICRTDSNARTEVTKTEDTVRINAVYPFPCGSGSSQPKGSSVSTKEGFAGKHIMMNLNGVSQTTSCCCSPPRCKPTTDGSTPLTVQFDGVTILSTRVPLREQITGPLELIPSVVNRNEYTVLWQGQIIDTVNITGDTNGGKFSFSTDVNSGYWEIQDLRWKYLFNCEVENDEVVIADEFAPGTTFNIGDLTFPPVKFCLDSFPAVVRSTNEQGITADIRGEITRALARGEDITVNQGETIMISYIADFEEGATPRCEIGEVYNTERETCIGLIEVEPDVIQVFNDVVIIEPATGEVLVNGISFFGDSDIGVKNTRFTCQSEHGIRNWRAPSPEADCWSGEIYQRVLVNEEFLEATHFSVAPIILSRWLADSENCNTPNDQCVVDTQDNRERFRLNNFDGLSVTPVEQEYTADLDEEKTLSFIIENNYVDVNDRPIGFSSGQSGVIVTQTRDIIFGQSRTEVPFSFNEGTNELEIPVDTSIVGEVIYEVVPYVMVGGTGGDEEQLVDDEKLVINFFVESPEQGVLSPEAIFTDDQETIIRIVETGRSATPVATTSGKSLTVSPQFPSATLPSVDKATTPSSGNIFSDLLSGTILENVPTPAWYLILATLLLGGLLTAVVVVSKRGKRK